MKNEIQGMRSLFGVCGNPYADPKPKQAKKPRPMYKQPPELAEFQREYNAHEYDNRPMIPEYGRVYTRFRDDTANGLTTAVIAHLQYNGHFAARVNVIGIYDARRGKYRPSGSTCGMADISAVVNGRPLQIEIKAGKDRPRADQLQVQRKYQSAGGMYVFIHNFAEWVQIYRTITPKEG